MNEFAFSKTFGWTPEQIRSLSEGDYHNYLAIMQGMDLATQGKDKNGRT